MESDLHGYHPRQIVWNGALVALVQQVWEMGESELTLIHGHGRNRGITLYVVAQAAKTIARRRRPSPRGENEVLILKAHEFAKPTQLRLRRAVNQPPALRGKD